MRAPWSACIAAVFLAGAPTAAMPHDHATGVVKQRMELMEGLGKRMKAIAARIRDKRDLAAIKSDARAIAASAAHIVHMFPPDSTQHPTEAKAAIWQNWSDFERLAQALEIESARLADMNATDFGTFNALNGQVRAVSQTCGNCHEAYRVKR